MNPSVVPFARPCRAILVLCVALAACQPGPVATQTEVIILEVAAETVPCVGEMQGRCLQVRAPDEDAWRRFYSPIEGFVHEEGVRYTLEVERRTVPDPPADGSSYAYRLLRVIEREPV